MKMFRLNVEDQDDLQKIKVEHALPNLTAAVRFALKAVVSNPDDGLSTGPLQSKQAAQKEHTMKVIAVANQKGGAGKSTTSTTLADSLIQRGYTVLIIDTDSGQASAQSWKENRMAENPHIPSPEVIGLSRPSLDTEVKTIGAPYDIVIIDVGGGSEKGTIAINAASIRAADLVVMPTQPSYYEVHGSMRTIQMIKERQTMTGGLPLAYALIVGIRPNAKLISETEEALVGLDMPRFQSSFKLREEHRSLPMKGLTGATGSKAAKAEANAFADEVLHHLKLSMKKAQA